MQGSPLLAPPHSFHIPVMGTGFTIDTPLKVARFGISSVVSLVDDVLIEQMRSLHSQLNGEAYDPITDRDEDPRARRITSYLNLLDRLVKRQSGALQCTAFAPDSEITRYYELLPQGPRKSLYHAMQKTTDREEKAKLQGLLRSLATPGSIDVNIMTKLDRESYRGVEKRPAEFSDAMSALRGYALSDLNSAIVFSAGLNARLYTYAAQFADFLPDPKGALKKRIVLKVSDYRSAAIQGKFLAKRGLWVSEYRIESGLNCGGHAFATDGYLLGPILESFKQNRQTLTQELFALCNAALASHHKNVFREMPPVRVTVQGGIGTAREQELLTSVYEADGTGWGSPFLLVPEATNVDEEHLQKLVNATPADVQLSNHSPLGVPFWVLTTSKSERMRQARIEEERPGSDCPKRYLALSSEFTSVPLCPASRAYQRLKRDAISASSLSGDEKNRTIHDIQDKTCICHDLAGGAVLRYGLDPKATPALCPGPNILYFKRVVSLREMIDHIYGRWSLLGSSPRPHMFINELRLYVDHLRKQCHSSVQNPGAKEIQALISFRDNLLEGIAHYRELARKLNERKEEFQIDLESLAQEIQALPIGHVSSHA